MLKMRKILQQIQLLESTYCKAPSIQRSRELFCSRSVIERKKTSQEDEREQTSKRQAGGIQKCFECMKNIKVL